MAAAGAPAGTYRIGDLEVEISPDGRSARLPGTPYLAGSILTMDRAVTNMMKFAGIDLFSAVKMASENAGKLFPDIGRGIEAGAPADMVLFQYKEEVLIHKTWIGGEETPNP
jgi:N-acetylglucosamine-6-phosphate deacetylase